MTCGIYKIENKLNGKIYIGQSINIERRWKDHRKAINSCGEEYKYPLYQAIRKDKLENFSWDIIEECSKNELDEKEKFYIKEYNSFVPYGYNLTSGGQDNFIHPMKLNYDKVQEIKKALKETNETGLSLANRFGVSKDTITSINVGRSWYEENIQYPIRPMKFLICKNCGNKISSGNKSGLCIKCYNKLLNQNKIEAQIEKENQQIARKELKQKNKKEPKISKKYTITRDELKNLIRTLPFTQIGKQFEVSDNAIRKWCDKYNLPRRKQDINQISDEEWEKI